MTLGVPVVATSIAVEGMHIQDGRECLIADTPQMFAEKIVEVYRDCELWSRLVHAANDNIKRHFNTDIARAQFEKAVRKMGILAGYDADAC
jgi:glycosyltransferase involved in cell wall biosynthesis